jgi:DNA ligase (NAD+)
MGEKSAQKLITAIAASKVRERWRLINGLGISHVGERAAQKLAEHFCDLEALAGAGIEELQRIPEVGPVMAQSIHDFFRNTRNQEVIDKLRKAGLKMREEDSLQNNGCDRSDAMRPGGAAVL